MKTALPFGGSLNRLSMKIPLLMVGGAMIAAAAVGTAAYFVSRDALIKK